MLKAFLFSGIILILFPTVARTSQEREFITVGKIQGLVEIKDEGNAWKAAREGMPLHTNNWIRTDRNSSAELILDQIGVTGKLTLEEKTKYQFSLGMKPENSLPYRFQKIKK